MLDKISNQKLFFISLIGIVVTSMILTTTFAYQSIRVNYSEGADSEVSINAGTLDVKYCRNDECVDPNESENNYNKISVDNLSFLPNYKTASYVEFVVDNTNSSDDVAYMITLSDLVYNKMFVSEAFKYTVVVVNEDGTLTEIITDNFSTLTGDSFDLNLEDRIYKYIEKGKTEKVRIYLWLDENVDVQLDLSDSSDRQFKGTVNVSSIFDSEVPPWYLVEQLIYDAKSRTINNMTDGYAYFTSTPLSTPVIEESSIGEATLSEIEDNYTSLTNKNSYYYRGNVKNNYLEFANMCWRIVRIEGDESIKLSLAKNDKCSTIKATDTTSALEVYGYYGATNEYALADYENGLHLNLMEWYNDNLVEYDAQIKEDLWCLGGNYDYKYDSLGNRLDNDNLVPDYIAPNGIKYFSWHYSPYIRFNVSKTVDLTCGETEDSIFSKIGTLSIDEVYLSGILDIYKNVSYLYSNAQDESQNLLTVYYYEGTDNFFEEYVYSINQISSIEFGIGPNLLSFYHSFYARPMITLIPKTEIIKGNGTINNPYIVKQI